MSRPLHAPHVLPALLVLAAPAAAPGGAPAWDLAPGTVVERTLRLEEGLTFESLSVVMDGNEVPAAFLPAMEMQFDSSLSLAVTDEVVATGDGRPEVVDRTFDEVAGEQAYRVVVVPSSEEDGTATGASPLEGETVRFAWDGDAGEHVARRGEGDGTEVLEGLAEDLELRLLLPPDDVEPGSTWEVDGDVAGRLLAPGGDLRLEWDPAGEWDDHVIEEHEGELEVTWERTVEEDGRRLAVLLVEGELLGEQVTAGDLEYVPVADGTSTDTTTMSYEVEGTVRWDLDAGTLADAELGATTRNVTHTVKDPGQPGADYESTIVMVGTWRLVAEAVVLD